MNEKQTPASGAAPAIRPTKKQKELLAYLETFIAEHGYSPSYREIMNGLQYTSVATVALHVGNLIKRGHLRKRDHSARSLEVVMPGDTPVETPLKTNEVKPAEEKWLVGRTEQLFAEAEAQAAVGQGDIDNLYVLLGGLRVLGLEGAAQSFMPRLTELKARSSQRET